MIIDCGGTSGPTNMLIERHSYNGNTLAFQAKAVGSIPTCRSRLLCVGSLMAKYVALNHGDLGSNPSRRTKYYSNAGV